MRLPLIRSAVLLATLMAACQDASLPDVPEVSDGSLMTATDCRRPAPAVHADGAIIELATSDKPPCALLFEATGTVLRSRQPGKEPDPAGYMAMDPTGRFFSGSSDPGTIAIWNADGSFVRTIGRPGAGPGELGTSPGALGPYFDAKGNLQVRDNGLMWTVFSKDLEFVRRFGVREFGGTWGYTAVLGDGSIISSKWMRTAPAHFFRIVDTLGHVAKSFGAVGDKEAQVYDANSSGRRIAYRGGQEFWAGPADDAPIGGYDVELWSADGHRVKTLRRKAGWLKEPVSRRWLQSNERRPSPWVEALHVGADGIIIIVLGVANDKWDEYADQELSPKEREAIQYEIVDLVVEAIDPDAGIVLATRVASGGAIQALPVDWFPGTNIGHRRTEAPDGSPERTIVRYRLVEW
jgi:hypothetical protein